MTITISASDFELTAPIRQYVEEKFSGLEKYTHDILMMEVFLKRETNHHQKGDVYSCIVNVDIPGSLVRIEKSQDDLYKAIDTARDHLRETLAQHKERKVEQRQTGDSTL